MASLYLWVRLLHILGAAFWLGAAAFHLSVVMRAVREAGPAAGGFMGTVLGQGGFGRYYGPVAGVTIAAGLFLYIDGGHTSDPFGSAAAGLLTVGVLLGILAFLEGILVQMPLERRMRQVAFPAPAAPAAPPAGPPAPPSPEAQARLLELGARAGRAGVVSFALILAAFLAMAGRGLAL